MADSDMELYHELAFYTLEHPDKDYFIHQHIVDAFTAQNADGNTKPVSLIFALAGLYLFIEKKYTGREVQMAHIKMTKYKPKWPLISLPEFRGEITVLNVIETSPGKERDMMIKKWCVSVWEVYKDSHKKITSLLNSQFEI